MSTTGGLAPSAAPLQFPEYIPWAGPAAPRVPGAQPGPGAQWARNGWRGWPAGRSHCAGEAPRCAQKPSPSRGVSASPGSGEVPGSWRATKRACRPVCGSSSWGSWQAQPPPSANGWERGEREGGREAAAGSWPWASSQPLSAGRVVLGLALVSLSWSLSVPLCLYLPSSNFASAGAGAWVHSAMVKSHSPPPARQDGLCLGCLPHGLGPSPNGEPGRCL